VIRAEKKTQTKQVAISQIGESK